MKLIFAQGNPEPEYSNTRHNVGFEVANILASKHGAVWSNKVKFSAFVAETTIAGEKVIIAKPYTFYNQTGPSARKIVDFYKIKNQDILAIHDDLALDFGVIRFRQKGRDAGNNGIKSLILHLGEDFGRLRIGILTQNHNRISDGDYVVSSFLKSEQDTLKEKIAPLAIDVIEQFCAGDIKHISFKA